MPPPLLFTHVQVGSEFAVGPLEQQRQIEALRVLDAVLASLVNEEGMSFVGLNFHVYHPDACPLGGFGLHHDGDAFGLGAGHIMRSHVADDGCLHVVADRLGLREALTGMDLDRARVLTKVRHSSNRSLLGWVMQRLGLCAFFA